MMVRQDFQNYAMRVYDGRIGKFLSVDPITAKYPELTPYQFASNRPLDGIDMDGLEYSPYSAKYMRDNTSVVKMSSMEDIIAVQIYKAQEAAKAPPLPIRESQIDVDFSNTIYKSRGGFEYSKKMMEYESNAIPGGPLGIKALKGEKVTVGDVAFEAAISFLPVGKIFKGIEGAGREVLEVTVRKTDNLAEHLTTNDIRGAIKDIRQTPVLKEDGTPF